jgi:hypothetical protein
VIVALPPIQTDELDGEVEIVGRGGTLTVIVELLIQPFVFVPVTV